MSNWGWPQWVMAILMLFGLVGRICLEVENGQKTMADILLDTLKRKEDWEKRMVLGTLMILFEWFVLVKGGFWG